MIDYKILEKFGTTKNRIREVMTAKEGTADFEHRQKLETEFRANIEEGVQLNLRHHELYTSADLAWDSNIISKQIIPLTLYAQGKINFESLKEQCKQCGIEDEELKNYLEYDEDKKEFKDKLLPKFLETPVNMVRSYVQRRHAAQVSKYHSQFPFLKYETYDRSYKAQLLSDILSQRMEIMANQFGYRHQLSQTIRDFLLYPHVVEFAEEAWCVEKQFRFVPDSDKVESYITKEGVKFVEPHPSRVFWDISSPLSAINTDTGPEFLGYWEVVKYKDVAKNTAFYNRESVANYGTFNEIWQQYNPYFSVYYPDVISVPGAERINENPATKNDRENNIDVYNSESDSAAPLILTAYYKKLIPKDYGFGEYPYPVWVRFVVGGQQTALAGEIMPDAPAQYYGYNEKDNRLANISFAHEVMPWQDQISNLLTQMLLVQKNSLLKILSVNLDRLGADSCARIAKIIRGEEYLVRPIVAEYNADKYAAMQSSTETIRLDEATQRMDITNITQAIIEMNVLAERTMNLSPQEQGQPSPRTTSATEILEIANAVSTLYNFISKAIDEGLAAKKRYLYNATVSLSKGDIHLAVMGRYPDKVIEEAGFDLETDSTTDGTPKQQFVRGPVKNLVYDYVFNSREGSDRTPSVKVAEVLTTLLPQILQIPGMIERMGPDKIYELVNAIMRNAGAGIEFKLDVLAEDEMAQENAQQRAQSQQAQTDTQTILASVNRMADILGQLIGEVASQGENVEELQARQQELERMADSLIGGADRREAGQRFEGGPVEPIPTQGAGAGLPAQPRLELDPFTPEPSVTAQRLPNP